VRRKRDCHRDGACGGTASGEWVGASQVVFTASRRAQAASVKGRLQKGVYCVYYMGRITGTATASEYAKGVEGLHARKGHMAEALQAPTSPMSCLFPNLPPAESIPILGIARF
jgi:hypothetical protein